MTEPFRISAATVAVALWRWRWAVAAMTVAAFAAAFFTGRHALRQDLRHRLLAASPFVVANQPDLVRFAATEAKPLYAGHCASCHGAGMEGSTAIGAPNLKDADWLYGDGGVYQIERTILFGIRDGRPQTRDVTEMPAFGQRAILSDIQIGDVVQYILKLNHRPYDAEAAAQGPAIFYSGNGSCYDCHASDAHGDRYYGAPDLTANVWSWGGTPEQLRRSIYYGRHGIMPGWLGQLDLEQIRALAVYIHSASHSGSRDNELAAAGAAP